MYCLNTIFHYLPLGLLLGVTFWGVQLGGSIRSLLDKSGLIYIQIAFLLDFNNASVFRGARASLPFPLLLGISIIAALESFQI